MPEVPKHVVRILRLREIRRMAWVAVRVLQLIVAVGMTLHALCRRMPPCECESSRRVVKRCRTPCGLSVARQTVVTELSLLMIRIGRAVEGRSVAIPARVWQIRILIVRMTLITC